MESPVTTNHTAIDIPSIESGLVPAPTERLEPEGEHLAILERIVVSPGHGRFVPVETMTVTTPGALLAEEQLLGHITGTGSPVPVRTPFAGYLMGVFAGPGERVRTGQAIAWLRSP
jgi:biotin carboxyl carrier protein